MPAKTPPSAAGTPAYPVGVIAKLLMLTDRRVQQLAKEGILPKGERGRYELAPTVQAYIRYLQDRMAGRDADGSHDWSAARARHMAAKAQLAEIELQKARGEVVEIAVAVGIVDIENATIRSRMLAIPARSAIRLSHEKDAAKVEAFLKKEVSEALAEMSKADAVILKASEETKRGAQDVDDDEDEDEDEPT
ncbi:MULTISPECIES: hypothetical protein [unclassified Yoonia]|uniref:hypothetical protein n=1 Tax=unclassified Yoonia TaxID=2629118 RepID=UPI002AFEC6A0|nr:MULTISPECIES: hypothetical protein [unclassified Yoonia]